MSIELRLLVYAAAGVFLLFRHREIEKTIEDFNNNFPRGGPPSPMHPLPAGDEALLRRKSPEKVVGLIVCPETYPFRHT